MSVHQESFGISKSLARNSVRDAAPEVEYTTVRNDSLAMFGAAIGGAVLGMLLTLLVLAIVNGGTLSFSNVEHVNGVQEQLNRVDENVDAVSHNIDTVSQYAFDIQAQLGEVETALLAELDGQTTQINGLNTAITKLDHTRQQFNVFMSAIQNAMSEMDTMEEPAGE